MSWILVIDESLESVGEIKDALAQIDPKIEVLHLPDSTAFLRWMDGVQRKIPDLEPQIPSDQFRGLITSTQSWKFKDVNLIGKFKALFVQNKFAQTEDELIVIFTGYANANFDRRRFEFKSVSNFVFKPFDKLVLKQSIAIALNGRNPVKNHFTYVHKAAAEIEMLKEIEMTSMSELGFHTSSEQKIEVGTIAKYYSEIFETKQHRSALAQVIDVSKAALATSFDVKLRFFALDQEQSFNVQKLAQQEKKQHILENGTAMPQDYQFFFVHSEDKDIGTELRPSFERFYDHPVLSLHSLQDLSRTLSEPGAVLKTFLFIDHSLIAGNECAEIDSLLNSYPEKNLAVFLMSRFIFSDDLEKELSLRCADIFYSPFNRSYVVKSLKQVWPNLRNREELFENRREIDKLIHVSNPVQITEVSESGVVLSYRREIEVGSFREFVFWMAHEIGVPTLLAQCHFTQKSEDQKSFSCHFNFFGMRHHELKFIRRWMLLQYVDAKQAGSESN